MQCYRYDISYKALPSTLPCRFTALSLTLEAKDKKFRCLLELLGDKVTHSAESEACRELQAPHAYDNSLIVKFAELFHGLLGCFSR